MKAQPTMPAASELLARLRRHAEERRSACAYREAGGGRSLNYGELAAAVDALAMSLRARLEAGSVVILSSANRIEYPVAFLGVLAAGCTVFPVSAEAADAELMRAAEESRA